MRLVESIRSALRRPESEGPIDIEALKARFRNDSYFYGFRRLIGDKSFDIVVYRNSGLYFAVFFPPTGAGPIEVNECKEPGRYMSHTDGTRSMTLGGNQVVNPKKTVREADQSTSWEHEPLDPEEQAQFLKDLAKAKLDRRATGQAEYREVITFKY